MNHRTTLIALAVSLAFAGGAARAQSAGIVDGSSNTISFGQTPAQPGASNNLRQIGLRDGSVRGVGGGASLTVRADVSGDITQSSQGSGRETQNQTVSIGGARDFSATGGTISAQGSQAIGSLVQTRNGNAGSSSAIQNLSIGSVSGQLAAANVQAVGSSLGSVSQTASNNSNGQRQDVDIGGIADVSGGTFRSNGLLNANISQSQNGVVQQEVRVGAIARATLQEGRTEGLVNASISQVGGGRGALNGAGLQRVDVGSITDVQAQTVVATGTLNGELVQSQGNSVTQQVGIGSVESISGALSITTAASAQGKISQTAESRGAQQLFVGTVRGGAVTVASTNANLTGDVTQTASGRLGALQRIAVGAIENATGRVSTNAVVSGKLTQIAGPNAPASQSILLGSVIDGSATDTLAAGN
jgi:hypothetical protein